MEKLGPEFIHLANQTAVTPGSIGKPTEYAFSAYALGLPAIGIADVDIRSWPMWEEACRKYGRQAVFGWQTTFSYALDQQVKKNVAFIAYSNNGLDSIHAMNMLFRSGRLDMEDIQLHTDGVIAVAPHASYANLIDIFPPGNLFLEVPSGSERQEFQIVKKIMQEYGAHPLAFPRNWRAMYKDYDLAVSEITYRDRMKQTMDRRLLNVPSSVWARNLQFAAVRNHFPSEGQKNTATPEGWLRPSSRMNILYQYLPQAIISTQEIAKRAEQVYLPKPTMPDVLVPEGETVVSYLDKRVWNGFNKKYPDAGIQHRSRLEYELSAIHEKELESVFLLALMAKEIAEEHDITIFGMGSGSGSAVNFCLGITDVDPIANGLSFDRFISKVTQKKPDIDFATEQSRQGDLIDLILQQTQSIGIRASRISTIPHYRMDGAIRAVFTLFEFDRQKIKSVQQILREGHTVQGFTYYVKAAHLAQVLEARDLEIGTVGTHGSKLIFQAEQDGDIYMYHPDGEGRNVAEIDKSLAERQANLDFVSLFGIDLNKDVHRRIAEPYRVIHNDAYVLDEIFHGRTVGVPFIETPLLIEMLSEYGRTVQYKNLTENDITVVVGFSRPAARKNYDAFIRRKSGKEPVLYAHPLAQEILSDTLGFIVFQEQALDIAEHIGGFSDVERETLRKAISKERRSIVIDRFQHKFMTHAASLGISTTDAGALFQQICQFAGYGFLKSHILAEITSTAYESAYQKFRYPQEFFEAVFKYRHNHYFLWGDPRIYEAEAERLGVILPQQSQI